ncbi:MAG: endonuclease/exonuclease/phosphatase family protein [Myxococcales bacterium]|nr:MAG: endonuclease/exonuclease/phosphatase family protein [Myxococcales bacterium]
MAFQIALMASSVFFCSACALGSVDALQEAMPEATAPAVPSKSQSTPTVAPSLESEEPSLPPSTAGCHEDLKIMTYNLGTGGYIDGNGEKHYFYSNPEPILEKVANLIVDQQADVVAIQEIDIGNQLYQKVNMPRKLYDKLIAKGYPMQAHFGPAFDIGFLSGNFLLSRLPFLQSKKENNQHTGELELVPSDYIQRTVADLSCYDDTFFCNWNFGQNVFTLFSTLQTACGQLIVVNYHPFPQLANEMAAMLQQVLTTHHSNEQTLLVGDFNITRGSATYTSFLPKYTDSCTDGSCLRTLDPSISAQELAVDYIFTEKEAKGGYQPPWSAVQSQSILSANDGLFVSDHLPLVADLHYTE